MTDKRNRVLRREVLTLSLVLISGALLGFLSYGPAIGWEPKGFSHLIQSKIYLLAPRLIAWSIVLYLIVQMVRAAICSIKILKAKRRSRFPILTLLCILAIIAYALLPFRWLSQRQVLGVQERTIRSVYHVNASGVQENLSVCFISQWTPLDGDPDNPIFYDPPADFLQRFSNLQVPVLPGSMAKGGGLGSVVHDSAGREGLHFSAGPPARKSIALAICNGVYYESGLSAAEYEVYLLRVPFGWVPVFSRILWIA